MRQVWCACLSARNCLTLSPNFCIHRTLSCGHSLSLSLAVLREDNPVEKGNLPCKGQYSSGWCRWRKRRKETVIKVNQCPNCPQCRQRSSISISSTWQCLNICQNDYPFQMCLWITLQSQLLLRLFYQLLFFFSVWLWPLACRGQFVKLLSIVPYRWYYFL